MNPLHNPQCIHLAYQAELTKRGYQSDPAQLRAVEALENCANTWVIYKKKRTTRFQKFIHHPPVPKGVYLHGGVGRGKSFLMDCFFNAVPIVRKTRLHFHEFMREVHRQLHELQGQSDPLDTLAKRIAKRHKLICFDEFHIAEITDALILYRLLDALCKQGVGFVMTSNFIPEGLYPNGMHRSRILPAIDLLNAQLQILNVDNGTDYRSRTLQNMRFYHMPCTPQADAEMAAAFAALAETETMQAAMVQIENRHIAARQKAGGVVWFDFSVLCGKAHSQNDYLEISTQFHTVLLSNVPAMPPRLSSEARRFTWLVDVLYDRQVKLVISAQVAPDALYTEGPMAHEFPRTVSRLNEMQSLTYVQSEKRGVGAAL